MRPNRIIRPIFAGLAALIALALLSAPAEAHKVNLFAYSEEGKLFVEAYFPDGKAVEDSRIEVFDSTGAKLLEGATDKDGKFSCPLPKKDDLKIVVNASMGHRAEFTLKKADLGE
jgi:nickel transport protein